MKSPIKLKKSKALENVSSEKTLRSFVSDASMRPASGSVIKRVNFPLTENDIEQIDHFSDTFHAKKVSVLRAALKALSMLDEDAKADLLREAEIQAPKPGRQPVKQ